LLAERPAYEREAGNVETRSARARGGGDGVIGGDDCDWRGERANVGRFNARRPAHPITMHQMLVEIAQGVHVDPEIVWAPTSFLKANKVSAWRDMTVWIPGQNETFGFHRRDISRAIAEGLTYRPLPLTAADALAWFRTLPSERQTKLRAGLTPERESELLAKLRAQ
jgi:2'-hydroxyisoflavone reductase